MGADPNIDCEFPIDDEVNSDGEGLALSLLCFRTGVAEARVVGGATNRSRRRVVEETEEGEIRTHKNCWYKPITDSNLINLSIKFTLSKNVTSLLPPGDKDLFKKALELAKNYSELSNEEYLYLEDLSKTSKPIGDREEIFI